MVSKYIGETEKHLREVFDACERAPVLLLFDEADALFGKRTEVSDAHDRYANIEVDYVLQRMESFNGVAVLATNRKGDLDSAFVRRLRFIVDFAAPERRRARAAVAARPGGRERTPSGRPARRRARLGSPRRGIRPDRRRHQVGGAGRGVPRAQRRDGPSQMRHVLAAARRELEKQGMVMRPGQGRAAMSCRRRLPAEPCSSPSSGSACASPGWTRVPRAGWRAWWPRAWPRACSCRLGLTDA